MRNSNGLKKAHADGKLTYDHLDEKRAWSKGMVLMNGGNPFTKGKIRPNSNLKRALIVKGIVKEECHICKLKDWRGNKIVLELDHIDGDKSNNTLENLRFLCPNCHSQTPTFRGRNCSGKMKVSNEDLLAALKSERSIRQALLKVGLVDRGGNYARARKLKLLLSIQEPTKQEPTNNYIKENKLNFIENKGKLCLTCGVQFYTYSVASKYCSRVCVEKSQRKCERPSLEQLEKDLSEMSMCAVGRKYGVSDNAVRKWVKQHKKITTLR